MQMGEVGGQSVDARHSTQPSAGSHFCVAAALIGAAHAAEGAPGGQSPAVMPRCTR